MLRRRNLITMVGASALYGSISLPALAQGKALHVVVGYPSGGPADACARIVARFMGSALDMPSIVENKPGALGSIAARYVMHAAPDGNTVLLCSNQSQCSDAILLKNVGYDPLKDFTIIAGLADIQQVLVVRKGLPVSNVGELIAYAKARPGKLNFASTGVGSGAHLAMELFMLKTGTDLTHIPYVGGAQMAQAIMAGQIDATFATVPSVLGQIKGDTMRALAVASDKPSPQLAQIPLLKDQGVKGCEADSWFGLVGPAGMPPAMVDNHDRIIAQAFAKPDIQAATTTAGMIVDIRNSATFRDYTASEIRKWGEVIRTADIKVDV